MPRGIGVESLSLTLDGPLPPQSAIGVEITGGWVIGSDDRTASAPLRQRVPHGDRAHA